MLLQIVLTTSQIQTETPFPPNSQNTFILTFKNSEFSLSKNCLVLDDSDVQITSRYPSILELVLLEGWP